MQRSRRSLQAALCACALLAVVPAGLARGEEIAHRFHASVSLETGSGPGAIVIGDLDGDGRADLAVAATGAGGLEVFRRQPGGGFARTTYGAAQGVPVQPGALAGADVDGDGDLDLAVSSASSPASAIFLNDGAGAFALAQTLPASGDVAFGDLDGDGDPELVLSAASPAVSVFTNTGGTFALGAEYAGGHGHLAIADLDGDGAADVAVADVAAADVSVLWNEGAGALSPPVRFPVQPTPAGIVAADVNGDGRRDLVTSAAEPAYEVGVLANLGGRAFAPVAILATGVPSSVVALGDGDGDGDPDLAVTGRAASATDTVSIWRNAGNGTFTLFETVGAGSQPVSAAFGDLDGDGDPDLAVTAAGSDSVRLYTMGDGRLQAPPDVPLGGAGAAAGLARGDLDGDGRTDLIVAQGGELRIFSPAGTPVPTVLEVGASLRGVAAGDVDGDGDVDVVVVDGALAQFGVLINAGGGTLGPPVWTWGCEAPSPALALADLEGYGDLDALVPCGPPGRQMAKINDGTGGFLSGKSLKEYGASSTAVSVAAADADGDGDLDLAVAVLGTNRVTVLTMYDPYNVNYAETWSAVGCQGPEAIAFDDVNGDHRPDVAVACRLDGRVRVYLNAGNGTFTPGDAPAVTDPRALALADVDCDGDRELVVLRGSDDSVVVLPNDGAGHFAPGEGYGTGGDATLLSVGDLDGDGDVDVATAGGAPAVVTTLVNAREGCAASSTLTVQVESSAAGSGSVTIAPSGAVCTNAPGTTGRCDSSVPDGAQVTLVPQARSDSAFIGWDGACSNNLACVVTMSQARTVRAIFAGPRVLKLSLSQVHGGSGALQLSPPALGGEDACVLPPGATTTTCTFAYVPGTDFSITPAPGAGSIVVTGGACAGAGPCSPNPWVYETLVTALFGVVTEPPVAVAGGPYTGVTGVPIAFDGTASHDPDGEPLTYRWTFDDGRTATGPTPTMTFYAHGTFTATLVVSDGLTSSEPATATIALPNLPPVVALTVPNGTMFPAGSSVPLSVSVQDDGLVTSVTYYRGATAIGTSSQYPVFAVQPFLAAGRHVITARATDSDGASTVSAPVTIDVATLTAPLADTYVREPSASNFGAATTLEVRRGPVNSGQNRWTYVLFNLSGTPTIQSARLRLYGNVSETTATPVAVQAFGVPGLAPWSELAFHWLSKPLPDPAVLATTPLVTSSTAARWYEWDLTAYVLAERAANRPYVTIVLKEDVDSVPVAAFRSRQATSNRPELRITPMP
jgi:PKD domain/FG-GAP-like repeat/Bacterial Ig domain/FG-GAP repeat